MMWTLKVFFVGGYIVSTSYCGGNPLQISCEHIPADDEVRQMVDELVENARKALDDFYDLDQKEVDDVILAMALAGLDRHAELARMAVDETRRGVYEDKVTKNIFATENIYHGIKYKKTAGIIKENEEEAFLEIAEPVGVVAALVPVTNPTSTTMFKSLICAKTRNPVIFSFHPGAQNCSVESARTMLEATVKTGAPEHCIGWIEKPSLEATRYLMHHPGVNLILATGGAEMVKAAYSTGKPALGVGPGNVPCYIEKTANLKRAVTDLIMSKTFDNGLICASEQAVIIDREVSGAVIDLMKENKCYFLNPEEIERLEEVVVDRDTCSINPDIVGQWAADIAERAGIDVPADTKLLVAALGGVGPEYPLSMEKLSPILACYIVNSFEAGLSMCEEMLAFGGLGHSAVIHCNDDDKIRQFSNRMRAGRIIVNSPATHGAIGDIYNVNIPSLTLGCGSYGGNATTSNVSVENLINVKRVAKRRNRLQWFRVPERIYFQSGAVKYLTKMRGIKRALIVTDPGVVKLGFVDKVTYHLNKRNNPVAIEVFSEVEPDPSVDTVKAGVKMMRQFKPDTVIALGGGSAIDAAKAMWLFYEHPEVEFDFLRLKFMDIRKRTFKYPKMGRQARLVAIPTTSGTGSEVSAFSVITHKGEDIKYPLADYELTPDVAIIDADFVMTVPSQITADTGMDVLTHAIEAYVSVMASEYTDALALKAIELVFEYLPKVYHEGNNREAREKMHHASCMAGMAFTNAFLGVCHSLAHKLGGEFHIPHGRANAILLPHVIKYNAQIPTKFTSYPQYEFFRAPEKYREIAEYLGLGAEDTEEGVKNLITGIRNLMQELDMPLTIAECGVNESQFMAKVDELAEKAFHDQSTISNPRQPLIPELAGLYRKAYHGTL